jgi:hypothetical protein
LQGQIEVWGFREEDSQVTTSMINQAGDLDRLAEVPLSARVVLPSHPGKEARMVMFVYLKLLYI